MRNTVKYFLFVLLICFGCTAYGQQSILDSLLTVIKTTKDDTIKIDIYNDLFLEYEFSDDKKAKQYLDNALVLAQKIDYKKGLASTYFHLGFFFEDKSNYSEALKNYSACLLINESINNRSGMADVYCSLGILYDIQGNYSEALKQYKKSLKIYEILKDKKGIATNLGNIAVVYYSLGNYPEALKNHFASIKIFESMGNKKGVAKNLAGIGIIYKNQGNYSDALKNYSAFMKIMEEADDSSAIADAYINIGIINKQQGDFQEALKNFFVALRIKEKLDNRQGMASAYVNIGIVYYGQALKEADPVARQKLLDLSLKNNYASLDIRIAIGDLGHVANSFNSIASVLAKQKKYKEAEEYYIKAIKLSKKSGFKQYLRNAYEALSELNKITGNYESAYTNHKLYILYRDSLDNEETRKKIIQSQMTFDFEKKEAVADAEHKKELESQESIAEEKSRKQKVVIVFVICGLLLVLIFAGFIFRSLRITRKQKIVIEEQKNIVELQKSEVERQKEIVEEHQKDIIDSIMYARRIQHSLLPTEKYIEKNLNRLMKK